MMSRLCFFPAFALALVACTQTPAPVTSPPAPEPADNAAEAPPSAEPATPVAEPAKPDWPTYDAVPLIPREVLFGNPAKVSPQLSPDGSHIAFIAPKDGVLNVWVQKVGAAEARAITDDKNRGIRAYFWAEDGKHILYIQDKAGDENWHLYAAKVSGEGEARDLTPIDGVRAQVIAVEKSKPHTILVGINDRTPVFHDVYAIDLRTGKRKLVYKNEIGAVGFIADHKLRIRIAQKFQPGGGMAVLYRKTPRAEFEPLVTWKPEDTFSSSAAGFTRNNRGLYLLSSAGANTAELRVINVRNGKVRTLAEDPTASVSGLMIHPRTYEVQAVNFERARADWEILDPSIEDDFAALAKLHDGDFDVVSRDNRDRTWLVSYAVDDGPVAYYTYDRRKKSGELLFVHRPELSELALAEMKPISYKARDGLTIHGYLTLPVGVKAKALPAVIVPHGGPWYRDTWGYRPMPQWLANRGYAVLQMNFRGSTGYGKKFLNAANREWGGAMQDDITDGTRWLIEKGIADPDRICIMGGSYGGYATLMGLAKEPDLYACGVDIVGVANLITWLNNIPPYWRPFAEILHRRVGHPEKDVEFLKSRSPLFLVENIDDPLLIGQGKNDPRVPRGESIQMRDALQEAGKEVVYMEFEDEGHGFAKPENRLEFFAAAESFLAKHIGGRVQP